MSDETLSFVMDWYAKHCDEDWEHSYGLSFSHTRAGGWSVKCDLVATDLEGVDVGWTLGGPAARQPVRWRAAGSQFEATAATGDLAAALQAFRDFAKGPELSGAATPEPSLDTLSSWAHLVQDSVPEHEPTIRIDTLDNPGWSLMVRTDRTPFGADTPIVRTDKSELEWLHWWSTPTTFEAACGPRDLPWAVAAFAEFAAPAGRIAMEGCGNGD